MIHYSKINSDSTEHNNSDISDSVKDKEYYFMIELHYISLRFIYTSLLMKIVDLNHLNKWNSSFIINNIFLFNL